ncbi:ficolin-1-like [Clytia hemisphaerica]|uniref:ficolin-1-like n=1 Tax=Clytia hemisphaerica TaxID=252671 RepID=UPI0034D59171
MELAGGGWTVLQQRVDGSVSFDREWVAYKHGFGTFNGNFWLGNDRIHNLTTSNIQNELLFDLTTLDDSKFYPAYDNFKVDGENERYKLTVGGYVNKEMTGDSFTSSMADSLDYHNGMEFSTKDRDHDTKADQNCAATRQSGWWFIGCWRVSLNGVYGESDTKAMGWTSITNPTSSGHTQHFKYTRMLVRKK